MKVNSLPGEFGFHALVKDRTIDNEVVSSYILTRGYFFKKEDVEKIYGDTSFIWPVEVYDNGSIYIPSPEELQ